MQIQQFQKGKVLGEMKTTFFSPPQKLSTVSINLKIETTKNFRSIYFQMTFLQFFFDWRIELMHFQLFWLF